jgi:hypothetical protein
MTAARLSPTASLLRNSKLFTLPPSVSLPPVRPSAEAEAYSDSATTHYPTRAAIETPRSSLHAGDWGLKRALPLKSTTRTSTPTIRLPGHIDSESHVTDFESAADHVVTLKKWQNIDPYLVYKSTPNSARDWRIEGVFKPNLDNTTETRIDSSRLPETISNTVPAHLQESLQQFWSDQKAEAESRGVDSTSYDQPAPRTNTALRHARWKYTGPWLAGMTNSEFNMLLKQVTSDEQLARFSDFLLVRDHLQRLMSQAKDARIVFEGLGGRPGRQFSSLPEGEDTSVEDRRRHEAALAAQATFMAAAEKLAEARSMHHRGELIHQLKSDHGSALHAAKDATSNVNSENQQTPEQNSPNARMQYQKDLQRRLRRDPKAFAEAIAEFLDLADGPVRPHFTLMRGPNKDWEYMRGQAPTERYRETGPPRTHPSAGFSYSRSSQYLRNDPELGPSETVHHLPARILKDSFRDGTRDLTQNLGVAGLITTHAGSMLLKESERWRPKPNGPKMVVKLTDASIKADGRIEIGIAPSKDYSLDDKNIPYNRSEWEYRLRAQRSMELTEGRLGPLDQPPAQYRKAQPLGSSTTS